MRLGTDCRAFQGILNLLSFSARLALYEGCPWSEMASRATARKPLSGRNFIFLTKRFSLGLVSSRSPTGR